MKFMSTAGALRNAINTARQATPATPSLLAYTAVQLVVDGDQVKVTGSDGDTTIIASTLVTGGLEGSALILPKPLVSYLNTLAAEQRVSLETSEQQDELVVHPAGSNPYRFRTVASTFPQAASPSGSPVTVDMKGLQAGLAAVRTAVAKENPVVQLVSGPSGLTLHATDNYRLTRVHLDSAGFGEFSGILPLQVLDRVAKLETTKVTVDSRARVISFISPEVVLTTRLLSVPFPAVDGVLQSVPPHKAALPAAPLLQACSRLAAITESSPVKCALTNDSLTLNVSNADLGSGTEEIAVVEHHGAGDFEFLARLGYIQDAVVSAGSEQVVLHYSGAVQPLFIMGAGELAVLTVVMPVRG